ncbi:uncharacterized protein LOC118461635 [Anopheles albimanus]|uniref:uncharacterized protein LOC118461635 n=1 Tax=Anopheles albimanus TaxID=7167 RepID=UPI00163EB7B5|nr:uncharacterized protein LOC118461635 [Anopheles albimanus]
MYACRHLLLVLLAIIITGSDVMAAFSEDEDDSSETVGSLEQAFSLYPEDFTEGNSEELGSLLLLLQQQQDKASPPDHRLPVDDFTGTDSPLELDGGRTSTSTRYYSSPTTPLESQVAKGKPVRSVTLAAAAQPLTGVSEFFRSMLERFGVVSPIEIYQSPGPGPVTVPVPAELTTERSRLRSYRYRPHFVSTAKGLRNIPAQLNDGQLVHAPDDATDRPMAPSSSSFAPSLLSTVGRRPAGGEPTATVGRPSPVTTPSSTIKNLFNSFKRKIKAIYPGTVWCGDGNQAKSEDDIGFFYLTDSCCRAHDLCPITIAAGEQFNRLRNNGHFTRSHCDCDKQFYNCLKNADTLVSRQIGYTYFNLLKPQCFRYEHPKVSCTKRKKGKCLTYVVNEQQSKEWQWFDNLIF